MLLHVVFRQLDADGETLYDEDDSGELEGDLIGVSPRVRIDEVGGMRTKDDTAYRGDRCFTDVESLFDEGGT